MAAAGPERHGDVSERRLPWSDYKLEVCVGWIFLLPAKKKKSDFIPLLPETFTFCPVPARKSGLRRFFQLVSVSF